MLEFSYSDYFGENPVPFIVGYRVFMMFMEPVVSKTIREALLVGPLSAACEVVLFLATMGANDFMDFIDGYFIELILAIAERLLLQSVVSFLDSTFMAANRWVKSRTWYWSMIMFVTGGRM